MFGKQRSVNEVYLMSVYEKISGFADGISQDFDQQLKTVTDLGMKYI